MHYAYNTREQFINKMLLKSLGLFHVSQIDWNLIKCFFVPNYQQVKSK